MLERFLQFIKKHALFDKEDRLLVAVSGGVDSMVLCELLLSGSYNFSIAHCNFQLRGGSADLDEKFVIDYAEKHHITYHTKKFETRLYAKEQGISTQMAARTLRYEWFDELKDTFGYNVLITAHHLNDVAETMLLNLTRGTSINGLAGIPVAENGLVRPLIRFDKSAILGYAINHQMKWREDASNASTHYLRNKLRHEVVPVLADINPSFLKQVERLAAKNTVVKKVFASHMNELRKALIAAHGAEVHMVKSKILDAELSAFELQELLMPYGFNYEQCESILEHLDQVGAKYETSQYELFIDRDQLQVVPVNRGDTKGALVKESDEFLHVNGGYQINYRLKEEVSIDVDPKNAMLDLDKLTFPLVLRPWERGDVFRPLGMKGKKLISDFLIDEKVPLARKEKIYVLASANDIVWLVGFRISDDYKIVADTKMVFHLSRTSAD